MNAVNGNAYKTLGRQSAKLVTGLYEQGRRVFRLADAARITGLGSRPTRNLVSGLVHRGIATRLKPGLFNLVPFELGEEREYVDNPFVVAREMMREKIYYISHASAMDIHQMVTQPQLVVYVTSPHPMRIRTALGTEYRFVRCQNRDIFGLEEHWVDGRERVIVSDLERTILDGLKQPEHCGGVTEVAKGMWIRKDALDVDKLIDYALRLAVGATCRRLGYLLELYGLGTEEQIQRLRSSLTSSYALLDPVLPADGGKFLHRWRLRVNIDPEELDAVVRT